MDIKEALYLRLNYFCLANFYWGENSSKPRTNRKQMHGDVLLFLYKTFVACFRQCRQMKVKVERKSPPDLCFFFLVFRQWWHHVKCYFFVFSVKKSGWNTEIYQVNFLVNWRCNLQKLDRDLPRRVKCNSSACRNLLLCWIRCLRNIGLKVQSKQWFRSAVDIFKTLDTFNQS